ncbi:hypothetical protein H4R27_000486 [Coemansia aciculifera]|nr:hypothetical protein H4R27_000486 [Coemansia aciculifera]
MVNRMAGFIEEYYPAPALVNYRAVSNFMWIVMEDCIRMHDMLQDNFKWIEAYYEQAAALRAQGPTFKEIAWHLFPTLTGHNVCSALKGYSSPERVLELISAGELDKISRLVDEYAGKYTVTEIIDKIRAQLNLGKRHCWYSKFSSKWTEEETRKLVDYTQSCD